MLEVRENQIALRKLSDHLRTLEGTLSISTKIYESTFFLGS